MVLEAEAEKQIWVPVLKPAEAAELLVHSSPRNLMLREMGQQGTQGMSWADSMRRLADQPALQALKCHPRAIRRFVPYLGALADAEHGNGGGGGSVIHTLDGLVETARRCYEEAALEPRRAGAESSGPTAPTAVAGAAATAAAALAAVAAAESARDEAARVEAQRLSGDPESAALWAGLAEGSGKSARPAHEQTVEWSQLGKALEADLAAAVSKRGDLPSGDVRQLTSSDVSFLRSVMAKLTAATEPASPAETSSVVSYGNWVAFAAWWAPVRRIIKWLRADWSGGKVHGFLDRRAADKLLAGRPPGTFLLRFSETKVRPMGESSLVDGSG